MLQPAPPRLEKQCRDWWQPPRQPARAPKLRTSALHSALPAGLGRTQSTPPATTNGWINSSETSDERSEAAQSGRITRRSMSQAGFQQAEAGTTLGQQRAAW